MNITEKIVVRENKTIEGNKEEGTLIEYKTLDLEEGEEYEYN